LHVENITKFNNKIIDEITSLLYTTAWKLGSHKSNNWWHYHAVWTQRRYVSNYPFTFCWTSQDRIINGVRSKRPRTETAADQ